MTVRVRRSLALLTLVLAGAAATVSARAAQAPKDQTATAFYHAYRAALAKAQSIDDLRVWVAKESLAKVEASPKEERPMMFKMMQGMALDMKDLKVLKETPTATGAELQLEAMGGMMGGKMKGTVAIVKEAGAWKIGRESWSSAP